MLPEVLIAIAGLWFCVSVVVGFALEAHSGRDKRTLTEKNWDWIMGPELPSTCSHVGHSYVIDPLVCDWCGAERWVTIRAERVVEDLKTCWRFNGMKLRFETNALKDYALMGSREHVLCMPARAGVVNAATNERYGNAGKFFDSEPSSLRSCADEARKEAEETATRAAERHRATSRYAARRYARTPPPLPKHVPTTSYPGRPDLATQIDLLKKASDAGVLSGAQLQHRLREVVQDERRRQRLYNLIKDGRV